MKTLKSNFICDILKRLQVNFLKIFHARGTVHEIALGAAIGAFWGVFPTFGLSTILSLLLYKVLRFNLPAALSAAFISNPLTSPFLLMISYKVGTIFIPTHIVFDYDTWRQDISVIGYVLLIGATIVSTVTAITIYLIVKNAIEKKRKIM